MPRPTRWQKVVWFLGGLLLLLGGLYGMFGCFILFALGGNATFGYCMLIPFAVALCGYALMVQSIIAKSAPRGPEVPKARSVFDADYKPPN